MPIDPFTAALSGGFAAVSFFQTRSANKANANAANRKNAFLGQQETRAFVQNHLNQSMLAGSGRRAIGSANVRLMQFAEGRSIDRTIADASSRLTRSAASLDQRLQDSIDSIRNQQEVVAATANSQMQNPLLAAVQGGIQGASMSKSLQSAFSTQGAVRALSAEQSLLGFFDDAVSVLQKSAGMARFGSLNQRAQWADQRHDQLNAQIGFYEGLAGQTSQAMQFLIENE